MRRRCLQRAGRLVDGPVSHQRYRLGAPAGQAWQHELRQQRQERPRNRRAAREPVAAAAVCRGDCQPGDLPLPFVVTDLQPLPEIAILSIPQSVVTGDVSLMVQGPLMIQCFL